MTQHHRPDPRTTTLGHYGQSNRPLWPEAPPVKKDIVGAIHESPTQTAGRQPAFPWEEGFRLVEINPFSQKQFTHTN